MAESEEELKILLINIKKKKKDLSLWHYGPVTSWQIEGKNREVVTDFLFLGSKITADGDWKIHIVKAIVFPAGMYGCESWTVEKAEHQGIGAFELWCWRRLLRVPGQQGDQSSQS